MVRGDDTTLSTGFPGRIECAWQIKAKDSDGWDPESKLSKIFYDENGNETNKNALQIFKGMPHQVDFPMLWSPLLLWFPHGMNLDDGVLTTCGYLCNGSHTKPLQCTGHKMALPFRDPNGGPIEFSQIDEDYVRNTPGIQLMGVCKNC